MAITKSRRTAFTASHLDPKTKKVLEKKAKREKKSVSAIVSEAVEEKLERDAQQEPK
jgi:predicted transcriptional regulator